MQTSVSRSLATMHTLCLVSLCQPGDRVLVSALTLINQACHYLAQLAHVVHEVPGATLELNRKAVLLISGPLPKMAALGWGLTPATVGSYCPGPTRLFLSPVKTVPSGGGCACKCPSGVSSYLRVADTDLGFQTQTWAESLCQCSRRASRKLALWLGCHADHLHLQASSSQALSPADCFDNICGRRKQ